MTLSESEIQDIAKITALEVVAVIGVLEEEIEIRDVAVGSMMGDGAIPVHGREKRKAPCRGCRLDPSKPLEAGNVMATTEDAIGTLSPDEVRDWCSEIMETKDGRCTRAMGLRKAAQECKEKYPNDSQKYFECFIPKFREIAA